MKRRSSQNLQEISQFNQSHYFLLLLLVVSMIACYLLFKPYWNPLILAMILSILMHPVNKRIERWVKGRRSLAAFLSCTLLTLVVLLPLFFVTIVAIQQGIHAGTGIYNWVAAEKYNDLIAHPWSQQVVAFTDRYLPDIQKVFPDFQFETLDLRDLLLRLSSWLGKSLLNQGKGVFGNITALIGKFFLMLFAFFFLLRDQEKILKAALHLIPLSGSHERKIIDKVKEVSRSAILGALVTAIAQGTAGGIAFTIAGLPGIFWGAVMTFTSLIPLVGTIVIWLPAAVYLFLSGRWGYGIFMLLWGALVVSMLDNLIRPLFMAGSGKHTSTLLIFLSFLGGLNYFGLIGLLYGPLIVGLTLVLLYIYSLEFKAFLTYQDKT